MGLILTGIGLGLGLTVWGVRLPETLLFGVSMRDALTYALAAVVRFAFNPASPTVQIVERASENHNTVSRH
jgi:hypothetical protein